MKLYEIKRLSPLTGKYSTMMLPVAPVKIQAWLENDNAPLIQDAFPELNADQREFILTGYTPEDWDNIFINEEE